MECSKKHQSQALWESKRPTRWPCTRPPVSLQSRVCVSSVKEICEAACRAVLWEPFTAAVCLLS